MASLSHRQGWSFAVLLTVFPCVFFASTSNDTSSVTYRTGTSEVRVAFFTTDENNHLVERIDKNDFAVVDGDTIIRDFRSFTRSDETALDIVLLVDASESVAARYQAVNRDVLRLLSQNSSASSDRISVITFSGLRPLVVCSGDCNHAAVEAKLVSASATGPTPLFDALRFTAEFISNRPAPGERQVVILFSDGVDTISGTSLREAIDAVAATGAVLYTVDVHASPREPSGRYWLQQMAESTGGRSFSFQDGEANILQAVLADMRASYVVTYRLPSRSAGFHSLRILPKHNLHLRFHCRRGYFYEEIR
ncbi:MAG TPA: VWA domain-containing protein [Candidatus Dormibacteraeota bacterium]|nr:VWA domain-containing protein [Candidatus Dormibacteraeota bacterium]